MRVAFYTLGCKVNQYETEVLSARFAAAGFDVVAGHAPGCDAYVVGSCTVTGGSSAHCPAGRGISRRCRM